MKPSTLLALASSALAMPLAKRAVTDADILQFALTLEHLENVFYKGALDKFTKADFKKAGLGIDYYTNLEFIAHDEESHVLLLEQALTAAGAKPEAACTYSFPYTDVSSFITLSSILEGVGTSAYLGAAPLIQNKAYLGVAGSILVTEAIHTSLQRFVRGEVAPANPYGTGLGANEVYTLAAQFITSCPSTNSPLPFTAFPTLASTAPAGSIFLLDHEACFTTKATLPSSLFVTFVAGLNVTSVAATSKDGSVSAAIPSNTYGQTYVLLTNANVTGALTDAQVIAGPAVLEIAPPYPTRDDSIQ